MLERLCSTRGLLFIATLLVFQSACNKSDFENLELADHSSQFAFPLFNTKIKLEDLLVKILNEAKPGDTIIINPDKTLTLSYSGKVAQKPATEIFTSFTGGAFPLTDTITQSPIDTIQGVNIYKASLRKGELAASVLVNPFFPQPITVSLRVPQMSKNGEVFKKDFTVAGFSYIAGPYDVAGYELNSSNNTLEFIYDARKPDGTRVEFKVGVNPTMIIQFNGLEFSYLEGFWGLDVYPLTRDTIEIDINQTDLKGDVRIKNPRVTMRIANSWGFPTRGVVKYMSFIGQDDQEIKLNTVGVFNNDSLDFNYPSFALNEVGQTKYTDVYLDKTNSNIDSIFNAQPKRLIYEVVGISNATSDPTITGFITDESNISLTLKVELELEGSVRDFGAEQTLDLNFGEYSDLDTTSIEDVEFKLVVENGTPIAANLQVYFRDELGNNLDSLFNDLGTATSKLLMEAASINSDGIATDVKTTPHLIPMTITRFNKIREAKVAFLQTSFTTAQGGLVPVKLLADNEIVVKMGMKVRKKFN